LDIDIAEKARQNEKKYDFVFVGYFRPEKRLDVLMRVFYKVVQAHPRAKLLLIGDGPLKKYILNLIKYYKFENNVTYVAEDVKNEEIYQYLWQSKAMIMTSQTEGLPVVLLEAMLCEIPFIVPRVGDITDLAKHEQNAIVVDALDEEEFKNVCLRILKDEDFYQRLKRGAIEQKSKRLPQHHSDIVTATWNTALK
jgi:glycosyltransferase involved in cell wall biosynthesis